MIDTVRTYLRQSTTRRKLSNDDDCPLHRPSYIWVQCHQNQYGNNFCLPLPTIIRNVPHNTSINVNPQSKDKIKDNNTNTIPKQRIFPDLAEKNPETMKRSRRMTVVLITINTNTKAQTRDNKIMINITLKYIK